MTAEPTVELSRVWEPIDIGPHTLKHRIGMTPHGMGWISGMASPAKRALKGVPGRT